MRRDVVALDLPLRSVEIELGPSQCEFTFQPQVGLAPADTMMLFRSAVKQICRRQGYHASFMCRPKLPNVMSSGWHLHQSLRDRRTGGNAFVPDGDALLSPLGRHYLGGLLAHARARGRVHHADDQRLQALPALHAGARPRDLGPRQSRRDAPRASAAPGDAATRLENRVGEPAANPYLYMASQIVVRARRHRAQARSRAVGRHALRDDAPLLPKTLDEALAALREDHCLADGFGQDFVDYYLRIKQGELARYQRKSPSGSSGNISSCFDVRRRRQPNP